MWGYGLDQAGSGQGQVAGICECGNGQSGSIKLGEFLNQLQSVQLLKKDSAAWSKLKGKGKGVPLQAWSDPRGSRKLRFLDYVTTAQDCRRLSAVRTGQIYPRKCFWYSFLLEADSTPGPQCDRKDFMSMKNPLTPAGIEPVTFRFVAQHLNYCATAVPAWST